MTQVCAWINNLFYNDVRKRQESSLWNVRIEAQSFTGWIWFSRRMTLTHVNANVNAHGHKGAGDVKRRREFQPISADRPAPHLLLVQWGRWAAGQTAVASEVKATQSPHGNSRQASSWLSKRVGFHGFGGAFFYNCPQACASVWLANRRRQQVG